MNESRSSPANDRDNDTMLEELKTTVLGGEARTDGGTSVTHRSETDAGGVETAAVTDVDPFRPATHLGDDGHDAGIEMDDVFGVLGNERRRFVLTYLSMAEGALSVSELAERIAAWECEKEIAQLDSQERKRVYVSLYQCHLPKMADISAISYDADRGTVDAGDRFDCFTHYLRAGA